MPEAAFDEHRDPSAAQQDVDAPTAVPTRRVPVNDEPGRVEVLVHGTGVPGWTDTAGATSLCR